MPTSVEVSVPILEGLRLVARYGKRPVLRGVNVELRRGEVVVLLGHNGAGKSTLLRALFGLHRVAEGEVRVSGEVVTGAAPSALLARGVAFVPQGRSVFPSLTVAENLWLASGTFDRSELRRRATSVLASFPNVHVREQDLAGYLSGGERQVVSIACALVRRPKVLLLDEPSLGLSATATVSLFSSLRAQSIDMGCAVLVVEHRVREALAIADRAYVLRSGEVSFSGSAEALRDVNVLQSVFL